MGETPLIIIVIISGLYNPMMRLQPPILNSFAGPRKPETLASNEKPKLCLSVAS